MATSEAIPAIQLPATSKRPSPYVTTGRTGEVTPLNFNPTEHQTPRELCDKTSTPPAA